MACIQVIEKIADVAAYAVNTDPDSVMAAQIARDVVKEAQSVGDASLIDDTAKSSNVNSAGNGQAQPTLDQINGDTASKVDGAKHDSTAAAGEGSQTRETSVVVADAAEADSPADGVAAHHAIADLSGGSDTDTSRADSLKDLGKGHVRSNSVKKPAAFKSVSVTKNFLAKAATTAPNARSSDKGVSATCPRSSNKMLTASPSRITCKSVGNFNTSRCQTSIGRKDGIEWLWIENRYFQTQWIRRPRSYEGLE
jgi:hypothetical protein